MVPTEARREEVTSSAATDPSARTKWLLDAFHGPIDRPRSSLWYRLGLAAVAIAMVVLPLLYVSLAGIAAWGVIALDRAILTELTGRSLLFSLLAVTVGGGVAVLFMFKPVFAPMPEAPEPHLLSRTDEPVLFDFVNHLCGVVGAPRPTGIDVTNDVNAAASFESGLLSVVTLRLKLTIGLPLVAGMTLRQFTGVLAHEFGHFSQGTGMRLTYVIRSVNFWFARVVYYRDAWDESLDEWASEGNAYSVTIANLARSAVWVTRKILWALMMAGHAISCFALRQMEYDADGCETQVSGSDAFEATMLRVSQLSIASSVAHSQLSEAWKDRRLVDDLPALIVARADGFDADTLEKIREHARSQTTGKLDTHPSHTDRILAARKTGVSGVFDLDAPADVLFLQFATVTRTATQQYYARLIGEVAESAALDSVDRLQSGANADTEAIQALREVFGPVLSPFRALTIGLLRPDTPPDPAASVEALRERIRTMHAAAAEAQSSMNAFEEVDRRIIGLEQRVGAEEVYFAARFGGAELPSLRASVRDLTEEARRVAGPFDEYVQTAARRLELAIALGRSNAAVEAGDTPVEWTGIEPMLTALVALQAQEAKVQALRVQMFRLHGAVVDVSQSNRTNEFTVGALKNATRVLANRLEQLRTDLAVPYPFEHAAKNWSVGDFLIERRPSADDLGEVLQATQLALGRAIEIHGRLLAHVCRYIRHVERALLPDVGSHPLMK